jgi:hypothetical protein
MALFRLGNGTGWGRRRRTKGSLTAFVVVIGLFFGSDFVRDEWQKGEEFSGRIVRVYAEKPFYAKSRSSSRDYYWDVESADGDTHSLRVRLKHVWNSAREGDWVTKRSGKLLPDGYGG